MARKPGAKKRKIMAIAIDDETKDRLRCYAYSHRMSLAQAVRYLIWDIKDVDMSVLDKIKEENNE